MIINLKAKRKFIVFPAVKKDIIPLTSIVFRDMLFSCSAAEILKNSKPNGERPHATIKSKFLFLEKLLYEELLLKLILIEFGCNI